MLLVGVEFAGPQPEIQAMSTSAQIVPSGGTLGPSPLLEQRRRGDWLPERNQAPETPTGSLWEAALIATVQEIVIGLIVLIIKLSLKQLL